MLRNMISVCSGWFYLLLFVRNGKRVRGHFDGLRSSIEGSVDREGKLDVQGEEWRGGEEGGGEEEAEKSGSDYDGV